MPQNFPTADGTARAAWALSFSTLLLLKDKGLVSDADLKAALGNAASLVDDQTNVGNQQAFNFLLAAKKELFR